MLPRTRYLISLLGLGLSANALLGQAFESEFKVRLANTFTTTSSQDHLYPWAWGVGVGVTHQLGKGRMGYEVGYHYKGGDPYLVNIPTAAGAGKRSADLRRSYDERGNRSDGIALRVSYARPLENTPYTWHVGLMLGGSTAKFSYDGDVASEGWFDNPKTPSGEPTVDNTLWRDTYSGSKAEWYKGVSPYAGFTTSVTEDSFIELNLLIYNYKTIDRIHNNGSSPTYAYRQGDFLAMGSPWLPGPINATHNDFPMDHFTTTTRWVPHLELNYGFRF